MYLHRLQERLKKQKTDTFRHQKYIHEKKNEVYSSSLFSKLYLITYKFAQIVTLSMGWDKIMHDTKWRAYGSE